MGFLLPKRQQKTPPAKPEESQNRVKTSLLDNGVFKLRCYERADGLSIAASEPV